MELKDSGYEHKQGCYFSIHLQDCERWPKNVRFIAVSSESNETVFESSSSSQLARSVKLYMAKGLKGRDTNGPLKHPLQLVAIHRSRQFKSKALFHIRSRRVISKQRIEKSTS